MFEALRKYAEFEGRARRSEYWLFVLLQLVLTMGLAVIMIAAAAVTNGDERQLTPVAGIVVALFFLIGLGLFIPGLAVSIRRLHDSDKSGFWLLLHFAPFGGIVVFIFTLLDGTPGPNRYGPDPLGRAGPGGGPNVVHHHHYAPGAAPSETL